MFFFKLDYSDFVNHLFVKKKHFFTQKNTNKPVLRYKLITSSWINKRNYQTVDSYILYIYQQVGGGCAWIPNIRTILLPMCWCCYTRLMWCSQCDDQNSKMFFVVVYCRAFEWCDSFIFMANNINTSVATQHQAIWSFFRVSDFLSTIRN